jgi:hypothetical protein
MNNHGKSQYKETSKQLQRRCYYYPVIGKGESKHLGQQQQCNSSHYNMKYHRKFQWWQRL